MAQTSRPSPVKLVTGAIFASEGVLIAAEKILQRRFGSFDYQSPILPFDYTDYYAEEMGTGLKRKFFSWPRLIDRRKLPEIKLYTNRIEKRFSRSQGTPSRQINLDPGYMSASKLVLATAKNYSHRIYLAQGVYAEVTLRFENGAFASWPWTYPDYKTPEYIRIFTQIRELYLKQLKQ